MIVPRISFTTKATLAWLLDGATCFIFHQPYLYGAQIALLSLFFWNRATVWHYLYCFFLYAISASLYIESFEPLLVLAICATVVAEGLKLFVIYSPQGRFVLTCLAVALLNGVLGWTILQFVVNLLIVALIIQRSS